MHVMFVYILGFDTIGNANINELKRKKDLHRRCSSRSEWAGVAAVVWNENTTTFISKRCCAGDVDKGCSNGLVYNVNF